MVQVVISEDKKIAFLKNDNKYSNNSEEVSVKNKIITYLSLSIFFLIFQIYAAEKKEACELRAVQEAMREAIYYEFKDVKSKLELSASSVNFQGKLKNERKVFLVEFNEIASEGGFEVSLREKKIKNGDGAWETICEKPVVDKVLYDD